MTQGQSSHVTMTEAAWIADVLQRIPTGFSDPSALLDRDFTWIDRWYGEAVQPCIAALVRTAGEPDHAQRALAKAHMDAADGALMSQAAWQAVLEPAFLQLFRLSYPYDEAFDIAHASATVFAGEHREMIEESFGSAESYAQYYAELNTGRSHEFASEAQAHVHADLTAKALAAQNTALFAASWPHIRLRAVIDTGKKLCPFAPELGDISQTLGAGLTRLAGAELRH